MVKIQSVTIETVPNKDTVLAIVRLGTDDEESVCHREVFSYDGITLEEAVSLAIIHIQPILKEFQEEK